MKTSKTVSVVTIVLLVHYRIGCKAYTERYDNPAYAGRRVSALRAGGAAQVYLQQL